MKREIRRTIASYSIGAPGSGKGTQAERLSGEAKLVHIASGDLFRQAEKDGTELGKLAKSYMEKGLLVPDEITIRMVMDRIASLESGQGFLLDGFPRTIEQAQAWIMHWQERIKQLTR